LLEIVETSLNPAVLKDAQNAETKYGDLAYAPVSSMEHTAYEFRRLKDEASGTKSS
jgi:hypothetical protein